MIALAVQLMVADTGQRWGKPETVLASAATVGLVVDALQSSAMQRQGYSETNPVLGRHPSDLAVAGWFAYSIGATWTLPRLIHNPTLRRVAIGAVVVRQLWFVAHNHAMGVRLTW